MAEEILSQEQEENPIIPPTGTGQATSEGVPLSEIDNGGSGLPYDFTKSYLAGSTLADMKYTSDVYKRPVVKTDFDKTLKEIGAYDEVIQDPDLYTKLKSERDSAFELYNKMEDYTNYTTKRAIPNTETNRQFAWLHGITPDYQVGSEKPEVKELPYGNEIYDYHFSGPVQVKHVDEAASAVGAVLGKDGNWYPEKVFNNLDNRNGLVRRYGTEGSGLPAYYWGELEDGEQATVDTVRSSFGDRTMETPWLINSLGRGFVGGMVGQTISGIGEFISAAAYTQRDFQKGMSSTIGTEILGASMDPIGSLIYHLALTDKEKTGGEIQALNEFVAPIVTLGNSLQKKNIDEEGIFNSWNSGLYSFGNGIGQVASMIAMGYGAGAAARLGGRLLPMLARQWPKVAMQSGLLMASSQSAAAWVDQGMALGYKKSDLTASYWPFFASTYITERFIGPNYWTGLLGSGIRQSTIKPLEEMGIKYAAATGKNIANASPGSKKYFAKTLLKTIMGNDEAIKKSTFTTIGGGIIHGGKEEMMEEAAQDVIDLGTAHIFNGYQRNRAEDIMAEYEDVKYLPVYMKDYPVGTPENEKQIRGYFKYKNGGRTFVTPEVYLAEKDEQTFANDVLAGKKDLDTTLEPASWLMAGIVGAVAGGFTKVLSGQNSKEKLAKIQLAEKVASGKTNMQEISNILDEEQAKSNIFGVEEVAAKKKKAAYMQEIDYYANIINKYGVNSAKKYSGVGEKIGITLETVAKIDENIKLNEEINKLSQNEDEDSKKRIEELQTQIKSNEATIEYNSTPKNELKADDPNYDPEQPRSQRYVDDFLLIDTTNELYKNEAVKLAEKRLRQEDSFRVITKAMIDERAKVIMADMVSNLVLANKGITIGTLDDFKNISSIHGEVANNHIEAKEAITAQKSQKITKYLTEATKFLKEAKNNIGVDGSNIDEVMSNYGMENMTNFADIFKELSDLTQDIGSVQTLTTDDRKNILDAYNNYQKAKDEISSVLSPETLADPFVGEILKNTINTIDVLNTPSAQQKLTKENLNEKDRIAILAKLVNIVTRTIPNETDGKPMNITIDDFIASNEARLASDEPISNSDLLIKDINKFLGLLNVLDNYIYLNKNYFQDTLEKDKKNASMSLLKNKSVERLTQNEKDILGNTINIQKNRLNNIKLEAIRKGYDSKQFNLSITINHLNAMMVMFEDINKSNLITWDKNENGQDINLILKAFDDINAAISTNTYLSTKELPKTLENLDVILTQYNKEVSDKDGNPDSEGLSKKRAEIIKTVVEIEKSVHELINVLGNGRLDKVIDNFYKKLPKQVKYNWLDPFKTNVVVSKKVTEEVGLGTGVLAKMRKGREIFAITEKNNSWTDESGNPMPDVSALDMYTYYMLTTMNWINRYGKNDTPTYGDVFSAYIQYETVSKEQAVKDPITGKINIGKRTEVPPFEQRLLSMIMVGFALNPENGPNEDLFKSSDESLRIENGLSIKGYAATGKTTVVTQYALGTLAMLKGNIKVLSIPVNEGLKETHIENNNTLQNLLGDKVTIDTKLFKEIQDWSILKDYDVIIFDEASTLDKNKIAIAKQALSQNKELRGWFLFDEGQIPPANITNSDIVPIKYIGEWTIPLVQIHSTTLSMFHEMNEYLRTFAMNPTAGLAYPENPLYINDDAHGLLGLKFVKLGPNTTSEEARKKVIDDFIAEKINQPNDNIILIVYDKAQYEEVAKSITDNNILSSVKILEEGSDQSVSGLRANKVFVAIDFHSLFLQSEPGKDIIYVNRFVQYALTAWTRQKVFLEMIVDSSAPDSTTAKKDGIDVFNYKDAGISGLETTYEKVYGEETEENILKEIADKDLKKQEDLEVLTYINPGISKAKPNIAPVKPSHTSTTGTIYNHELTPLEIDALKDEMKITPISLKRTDMEHAVHVTELGVVEKYLKGSLNTKNENENITRTRNILYKALLTAYFNDTIGDEGFTVWDELNAYKNAIDVFIKNNPKTKTTSIGKDSNGNDDVNTLKRLEDSLIWSFQMNASDIFGSKKESPLVIGAPRIIGSDGVQAVQANPTFIEIVGKDNNGKFIIDINNVQFINNDKTKVTDYDKAVAGAYISILQDNGYVINNYNIIPLKVVLSEGNDIEAKDTIQLQIDDKIDGSTMVSTVFKNKYQPITEEQYFHNQRIVNDPLGEITSGRYINKNTQKETIVDFVYNKDNSYRVAIIESVNGEEVNNITGYSLEYFRENYELDKVGVFKFSEDKYKSSSDIYIDKGALYTTTSFVTAEQLSQIPQRGKDYWKHLDSKGRIVNPIFVLKTLLTEAIQKNSSNYILKFYPSINASTEKNGEFVSEPWNNVVVLELNPSKIDDIYTHLETDANPQLWQAFKNKIGDETAIKNYIRSYGMTLSVLDRPEINFKVQVTDDDISKLLKSTKDNLEETILSIIPDTAFSTDKYASQLRAFNRAKLETIWTVANKPNQTVNNVYITNSKTGSQVDSSIGKSANTFVEESSLYGYNVTTEVVKRKNTRQLPIINLIVNRDNMDPVKVRAFSKKITKESLSKKGTYGEKYNKYKKELEDINKKIKALDVKSKNYLTELSKLSQEVYKSEFMSFLRNNKGNSGLFNNKEFGSYIKLDPSFVIDVIGNGLAHKVSKLIVLHKKIKSKIEGQSEGNTQKELADRFYMDPFINYDTSEIDLEMLDVYASNIGTPQVFFSFNEMRDVSKDISDDYSDDGLYMDITDDSWELMTGPELEAQARHIFGQAFIDSALEVKTDFVLSKDGNALWGKFVDGIIQLSSINGMVQSWSLKHEAMHRVMANILTTKSRKAVLDNIKEELGTSWDGTQKHLYEYAAEKFQSQKLDIPTTILGKFIQALRRLAKRIMMVLGLYKPTLQELIGDVQKGVFRGAPAYENDPALQEELEASRRPNPYNSIIALKHVINLFGSTANVDNISLEYVHPVLADYSHIGRRLDVYNPGWGSATTEAIEYFKQFYSYGEDTVNILSDDESEEKKQSLIKVKDMSSSDFLLVKANLNLYEENKIAYDKYIKYHLSSFVNPETKETEKTPYTVKILLQRLLPSSNIDSVITGKTNPTKEGMFLYNMDSSEKNVMLSMSDSMRLALSTIPYRQPNGRAVKGKYVPFKDINYMLMDFAKEAHRLGLKGFDGLLTVMNNKLSDRLYSSVFMKRYSGYIQSFLYEYGDRRSKVGIEEVQEYIYENNVARPTTGLRMTGWGLKGIIDNKENYINYYKENYSENSVQAVKDNLENKTKDYSTFLNGIASFYYTLATITTTTAKIGRGGLILETKNNQEVDKLKDDIKRDIQSSTYGLMSNGVLRPNKASKIMDLEDGKQTWYVDNTGLYKMDPTTEEKVKIIDTTTFELNNDNFNEFQDILSFMNIRLNLDAINTLKDIYNTPKYNVLAKNLYYMMLATRLNGELAKKIVKAEDSSILGDEGEEANYISETTQEVKDLLSNLKTFYADNGYQFETADQMYNKGTSSKHQLLLPSPAQFWKFLETIGEIKKYGETNFVMRTIYDTNGNARYPHIPSNTDLDTIGQGSEAYKLQIGQRLQEKRNYIDRYQRLLDKAKTGTLTEMESNEMLYMNVHGSTLIDNLFFDVSEDGNITYRNNPILTNKLGVTPTEVFIEIATEDFGVNNKSMTLHDMMKVMFEGSLNKIKNGGSTLFPVIRDTQADKANPYMANIWYNYKDGQVPFIFVDTKFIGKEVIDAVELNKDAYVDIFNDIVSYYETIQKRSIEKWNIILKTQYTHPVELNAHLEGKLSDEEKNAIETNLKPILDYIKVGDNFVSGNHVNLEYVKDNDKNKNIINSLFIEDWKKAEDKWSVIESHFANAYQDFISLVEESGYKPTKTMREITEGDIPVEPNTLQGVPPIILDELGIGFPAQQFSTYEALSKFRDSVFKQVSAEISKNIVTIKNSDLDLKDKNISISKFVIYKKEKFKELNTLFNLIYKEINPSFYNNPLAKALFYSHFVYNESISQLNRNGSLAYPDIIDMIKRAAGVQAPGDIMITHKITDKSKKGLAESGRMVIVEDIGGRNRLLNEQQSKDVHSNGYIPLNPITHELAKRSAGGIDGKVTDGSQKWVNFFYDIFEDNGHYQKASFRPINDRDYENISYYQDMFKMMLGPQVYEIFNKIYNDNSSTGAKGNYKEAIKLTADEVENKGLHVTMVDMVIPPSALKYGIQNVQSYIKIDPSISMDSENAIDNVMIDQSWNDGTTESYSKTSSFKFNTLRIQQVVSKDTENPNKPVATQMSYLIGQGAHNNALITEYNNILSQFIDVGIAKLDSLNTPQKVRDFIKTQIQKGLLGQKQSGSFVDEMLNGNISIQLYRQKALSTLQTIMNKYVKPTVSGIDAVQAPEYGKFYEHDKKPGVLFMPKDMRNILGLPVPHDSMNVEGFKTRRLNVLRAVKLDENGKVVSYYNESERINPKDELLEDIKTDPKSIRIIPGEAIMRFPFQEKFGIDDSLTLNDITSIKIQDRIISFYETGEDRAIKGDTSFEQWRKDVRSYFEGMSYEEIVNSLPNNKVLRNKIRFWTTRSQRGATQPATEKDKLMVNRDDLISNIAAYYKSFNDALDIFALRIPTALGSSASMYRLVAFDNSSKNTIYTSAEKSLLDGSDYDIDALQVYFNKNRTFTEPDFVDVDELKEIEEEEGDDTAEEVNLRKQYKKLQKDLFQYYRAFYTNPLNLQYILSVTNTDTVTNYAKTLPLKTKYANTMGTSFDETQNGKANKTIIGHEASAENGIVRLTHQKLQDRIDAKGTFIDSTIEVLFDDGKLAKAVEFSSELINAGTDGIKLGNPLGRIHINEATSPLLTGMIAAGYDQDKVYSILSSNPYIKKAEALTVSSKNIDYLNRKNNGRKYNEKIWVSLNNILDTIPDVEMVKETDINGNLVEVEKDNTDIKNELRNFINLSYIGEQIRRLTTVTRIQQNIGSSDYDLVNLKRNAELMLGMPIDEFLKERENIAQNGSKSITDKYTATVSKDPNEKNIRATIDLAWFAANNNLISSMIELIQKLGELSVSTFKVNQYFDNGNELLEKTGRDNWDGEENLNNYRKGIENHIIGKYINTLPQVSLDYFSEESISTNDYTFDLSKTTDRTDFGLLFPKYIRTLKNNYPNNMFVSRINYRTDNNGLEYIQFPDSNHLDPGSKDFFRGEFEKLSVRDKNLIRIYQLLVYGLSSRNGSFKEVISNPYHEKLSKWFDNYKIDDEDETLLREVIVSEKLGNTNRKAKSNYYTITTKGHTLSYEMVDKTPVYYYNNLWSLINTYGNKDQISNYLPAPPMGLDDIINLRYNAESDVAGKQYTFKKDGKTKTVAIKSNGWNGIYVREPRSGWKPYMVQDRSTTEMLDGVRVTVVSNNDGTFTAIKEENQAREIDTTTREDGLVTQRIINPYVLSDERTNSIKQLFESNPTLLNEIYNIIGVKNINPSYIVSKNGMYKDFTNSVSSIETRLGSKEFTVEGKHYYIRNGKYEINGKQVSEQSFMNGFNKYLDITNAWKPTNEDEQLAIQVYSKYLDSIFPNSKVKDIVYHGTSEENKNKLLKTNNWDFSRQGTEFGFPSKGAFFSTINHLYGKGQEDYSLYNTRDYGDNVVQSVINITNPIETYPYDSTFPENIGKPENERLGYIGKTDTKINEQVKFTVNNNKQIISKSDINDSVISFRGFKSFEKYGIKDVGFYIVFKPEQIHILGSKQDIEGFKKFVRKTPISQQALQPLTTIKTTSLYSSIIKHQTSRLSNDTLDIFLDKIRYAVPGIEFRKTSNTDIDNLFPHLVAYIDEQGVVWINTDRVTIETGLHEVSHIFIYAAKKNNIALYRFLMDSAKQFRTNYPDIAELMRTENMSDDRFNEELAARLMGWSTNDAIKNDLHDLRATFVEEKVVGIGSWVKSLIRRLFAYVKRMFNSIFGTNFGDYDFSYKTIFEIGQKINDMINNGEVVTRLKGSELIELMRIQRMSNLNISPIAQTIIDEKGLSDAILEVTELTEEERIQKALNLIEGNNWHVTGMYFGQEIDLSEYKDDRGKIIEYIKQNNLHSALNEQPIKFRENLNTLFNEHNGSNDNISILGTKEYNGEKSPIYELKTINQYKRITEWNPNHKYIKLQDHLEYDKSDAIKNLRYSPYFESMNVTVVHELSDSGQTIISLYAIENTSQSKPLTDTNILNIAKAWNVNEKQANLLGLSLNNTKESVNNMNLALLANDIMANNPGVKVRNFGAITIYPSQVVSHFRNYFDILKNIKALNNVEGFTNDVNEDIRKYFTGEKEFRNVNIDYEKVFMSIYDSIAEVDEDFARKNSYINDQYLEASLDIKRKYMAKVFNYLNSKVNPTPGDIWMIKMIKDGMLAMDKLNIPSKEMNTSDDIGNIELYFTSAYDVGNEVIQDILNLETNANHRIADKYLEYRKRKTPHLKFFQKSGQIAKNYNDLFVTTSVDNQGRPIKGPNGKQIEVQQGHILWTKDDREDPLYAKLARERNLSSELLEHSRWIVDEITATLEEDLYHYLESKSSLWNSKEKRYYTKEDMKDLLFKEWGYKKGMVPVMGMTTTDLITKGAFGQALKKLTRETQDQFNIYRELAGQMSKKDLLEIDKMPDLFKAQLIDRRSGSYGTREHLFALGISQNSDGTLEIRDNKALEKNRNITHDLETLLDYYKMSTLRKIEFENNVLPVVNGMRVQLNDMKLKGYNVDNTMDYLNMFTERTIFGVPKTKELKIAGVNVLPFVQGGSSFVSAWTMALNFNVGIMSASINGVRAWTEILAHSFDESFAKPKDLLKASAIFFSDLSKISQIARDLHIINMDQYGLLTHNIHKVTKKSPIDPQYIYWTNWASDFYARAVLMVSQMLHDGTYDAFTFNKETGEAIYDMSKDEQYTILIPALTGKDSKLKEDFTNEKFNIALAKYNFRKNQFVKEGRMNENDIYLPSPYLYEEMTNIKVAGDRIVGGYDNMTKSNLSNIFVGRMFLMFKNYLVMAAQDAIGNNKSLHNAGRIKVIQSPTGEYVAQWERLVTEGYITTIISDLKVLITTKSMKHLNPKTMEDYRKYNYRRLLLRMAAFGVMYMMYNTLGLIDKEKDKDDDENLIPENRLTKNWAFTYQSIFVIPQLVDAVRNPSAFTDIITRWFSLFNKKWENIDSKDLTPSTLYSLEQMVGIEESNDERTRRKIKEGIERSKEENN